MELPFHLLSSLLLMFIVAGANHAALEPKEYWAEVLPDTHMPSAIEIHLPRVDVDVKSATSVNVGGGGVNVNTGKGTSVNIGDGGVDVNTGKGTSVNVGGGGVGVHTGKGTSVNVGGGGVGVHTGKGTSVNVGGGGVGVNSGKPKPGDTSVHVGKGGVGVNTGKGTSVNVGGGRGVGVNTGKGTTVNVGGGGVGVRTGPKAKGKPVVVYVNPIGSPFDYNYAATDTQLNDDPASALFFLRNDLRPGKQFTLQLAVRGAAPAAFVPRQEADSMPFTTSELPSILSHYSIPPSSGEAANMKNTLQECESAPAAGEKKRCATSLEAMVNFATTSLGTNNVVAVSTEGGGSFAAERRLYKVKAVKRVAAAGGKGVVACHPEPYVYAVFFCHATTTSEVYSVDLASEDGGAAAKAVAVCHTDTAGWNPKHLAFRVLGVAPGNAAVCHFLPRNHVVWAAKV